ncbi:MAG: ATP-binding cassette domain-containing protein [Microthrixaceae bacterium]
MGGLRIESLTVRYAGTTALDGISISAGSGVIAIVGPNGSGKSTLLNAAATLLRPASGRILIDDADITTVGGRRHARRSIGYVPQRPEFTGHYTVGDAVRYAAWLHRIPRRNTDAATASAIAATGLTDWRGKRLKDLSGGTRQRVFIAQAIVCQPAVLLFDEITVGVDAEHRVALRRLIRSLAQHRTVLLSTHLTEDVELLADRVIALDYGRVLFDGPPAKLLAHATGGGVDERPIETALRNLTQRGSDD